MATVDLNSMCQQYRRRNKIEGLPDLKGLKLTVSDVKWKRLSSNPKQLTSEPKQSIDVNKNVDTELHTNVQHKRKFTIQRGRVTGIFQNLWVTFENWLVGFDPGAECSEVVENFKIVHSGRSRRSSWFQWVWGATPPKMEHNGQLRHDTYELECKVSCTGRVLFVNADVTQELAIKEIADDVGYDRSLLETFSEGWVSRSRGVRWTLSGRYTFPQVSVQQIVIS
ncbi:uncharacterized protein LOC131939507 [Physella acuta]|uniref:uncharacterized protein LOC131939507 n=1 Tax=Physella acuta TaxID=109671 RepID=UPI0027DAEA7C|nr:uncharacterized protein LOC131939507 [Physella acuta]XP_059153952.1 uncharacterized protein LOC131939507 [Physella acuta]